MMRIGFIFQSSCRRCHCFLLRRWRFPGIPFETEAELREKGTSRTPDVLLSCPIGVRVGSEWKVVCWIDSKVTNGSTILNYNGSLL